MDGILVILLLAGAGVVLAGPAQNPVAGHFETCFKEMKITDKTTQQKILTDPNFKFPEQQCFSKCILLSAGMIDKKGFLIPEGAKQLAIGMKKTVSDEDIRKCSDYAAKNGKNVCDIADLGVGCVLSHI